jgi:hypothetical protein
MSRPPTRDITLQFILRTLARLQMITRLDQELLAKDLEPHLTKGRVDFLGTFLDDVAHYMKKTEDRRHPTCMECGGENMRDHNGMRYCSDRCKQLAYRKRKRLFVKGPRNKRNKPSVRDASKAAALQTIVTQMEAEKALAVAKFNIEVETALSKCRKN